MQALVRTSLLALAAFAATAGPIDAEARPYGHPGHYYNNGGWGHGGWGHGRSWGGVGLGVGLGVGFGALYYGAPWYSSPWYGYPGYVVGVPAPVYEYDVAPAPVRPVAKAPPEPIVYPRNGQSPALTESDRQACDRWAMTQPSAMADASVFHRAALACMDGRGYTLR